VDFLFAIVLIIFFGRSLGMLMKRLGIQPVVGEILAGIILGPIALSMTNGSWGIEASEPLKVFSDFGIILLMLLSGLMTDFRSLSENSKASIIIGGLGVVVSFVLILLPVHFLLGLSLNTAIFVSVILSNTAIEVVARIFLESRNPRLSSAVLGASFVDDIVAVFLLGLVSSAVFSTEISLTGMVILSIEVGLFLIASLLIATRFISWLFDMFLLKYRKEDKIFLSSTFLLVFLFAIIARNVGLHEVIGAYIAGLVIGKWASEVRPRLQNRIVRERLIGEINPIMTAIFGPVFFGYIGVVLLVDNLEHSLLMALVILVFALAGKIIGCGLGGVISGFNRQESLIIGVTMCGRGALELVLLRYALERDVLSHTAFSALVLVTMFTIILTPVMYSFGKRKYPEALT